MVSQILPVKLKSVYLGALPAPIRRTRYGQASQPNPACKNTFPRLPGCAEHQDAL